MNICRSTLQPILTGDFSKRALLALADGKTMPAKLDFSRDDCYFQTDRLEEDGHRVLSISGVQEKIGLSLQRGKFIRSEKGSTYILKPIPLSVGNLPFREDLPANEHLTMQIASQIYGIDTAANACILWPDGEPAYLTRRFDYRDGKKISLEDFCQLGHQTEETAGRNYKYTGSYEEIALLIKRFCPSYTIELTRFFKQVLFCYLFSNGDAHMKNFSVYNSVQGDPVLTPAYDLLNTSMLIPNETRLALDLFQNEKDDGPQTEAYDKLGFYSYHDFHLFGLRIGLKEKIVDEIMTPFLEEPEPLELLVERSFLSSEGKKKYFECFKDRLKAMNMRA